MFTWTSIAIQDNQNTWGQYLQESRVVAEKFWGLIWLALESRVQLLWQTPWQQVPSPKVSGKRRQRFWPCCEIGLVESSKSVAGGCKRPLYIDKMLHCDTLIIQEWCIYTLSLTLSLSQTHPSRTSCFKLHTRPLAHLSTSFLQYVAF